MSGFIFAAHPDGSRLDPALLEGFRQRLTFRGPDGSAVWQDESVALAAAQLRATAESQSEEQPLSLDGTALIVGDVRLDGRGELLQALPASGERVDAAAADLALVLRAYHAWGHACVDHLRGDFAFVIWDPPRKTLFGARDQFGVASFFYTSAGRALIGGNTLQAILAHPEVSDELDDHAIGDLLLFGYVADTAATVRRAIHKLPPAHALTWQLEPGDTARIKRWRYWSPAGEIDRRQRRPEEYVERFGALFRDAVGDRLRTDRVATHLSGGLDSTSVATTAHALLRARGGPFTLRAYTIEHQHLFHDEEGTYAEMVSQRLGIERETVASGDFLERRPTEPPPFLPPEPGVPFDLLAQIEIQRRALSFTRVLLQAFGGDPALYPHHRHWLARLGSGQIWGALGDVRQARHLGQRPPLYVRWIARRLTGDDPTDRPLSSGFAPDFAARLDLAARWRAVTRQTLAADPRRGLATQPLWPHFFGWADPGFTGMPIRARFPFFDVRLLEFLLTVPAVPWFVNKTLLRESMRGILPEPVRQRPKKTMPAGVWPGNHRRGPTDPWWLELGRLPELATYVEPRWFAGALRDPPISPADQALCGRAIGLAFWLRHRQAFRSTSPSAERTHGNP